MTAQLLRQCHNNRIFPEKLYLGNCGSSAPTILLRVSEGRTQFTRNTRNIRGVRFLSRVFCLLFLRQEFSECRNYTARYNQQDRKSLQSVDFWGCAKIGNTQRLPNYPMSLSSFFRNESILSLVNRSIASRSSALNNSAVFMRLITSERTGDVAT